jgi:hypothetical protein
VSEKHCVVHREGLELDDAWGKVTFMLNTKNCYELIQRSSSSFIKKGKLEEFSSVTPYDVLIFRPLNEVIGLSRHFAVTDLMCIYEALIQYCRERVNKCSAPTSNCCLKILTNPHSRVALTDLSDVLEDF